jgi:hypothetical protein
MRNNETPPTYFQHLGDNYHSRTELKFYACDDMLIMRISADALPQPHPAPSPLPDTKITPAVAIRLRHYRRAAPLDCAEQLRRCHQAMPAD